MDLQPWNSEPSLEPHACDVCNPIVIDPKLAEIVVTGMKRHKFVICDFPEELQSHQTVPRRCGLIRHHIEHRGPAFEDALEKGFEKENTNLVLEIHSYDGNGYDIRTAYTMFMGYKLAEFDVYAEENDPAARYISRRPRNRQLASEKSFQLVRSWIDTCFNNHTNCPRPESLHLPTRVLDVSCDPPKLYVASEEEEGLYSALSYCWGVPQPMSTTLATLQSYQTAINHHKLPRSIQDAIKATQNMYLRYLWVDSLCIIQDDPQDIARELNRMPEVYKQAYVTISATSAHTCEDGFLEERTPAMSAYWAFRLPYRCPDGQLGSVILENHQPLNESDEPIHSRGWTLQETLLSPRFLSYGTHQMNWRCATHHITESGSWDEGTYNADQFRRGKPTVPEDEHYLWSESEFQFGAGNELDAIYKWYGIITTYTARNLSVASDKLPATSAIAQELSHKIGGQYLAGLWTPALIMQLLWEVEEGDQRPRPPKYRAPSWSWASVDGIVNFGSQADLEELPTTELVGYQIEPLAAVAVFGQVKENGWLTLRGRMKQASWTEDKQGLRDLSMTAYMRLLPMEMNLDCTEDLPNEIWCLEILPDKPGFRPEVEGLLLVSAPGAGCFRRVGRFRLHRFAPEEYVGDHGPEHGLLCRVMHRKGEPAELPDWFEGCEKRDVMIV